MKNSTKSKKVINLGHGLILRHPPEGTMSWLQLLDAMEAAVTEMAALEDDPLQRVEETFWEEAGETTYFREPKDLVTNPTFLEGIRDKLNLNQRDFPKKLETTTEDKLDPPLTLAQMLRRIL